MSETPSPPYGKCRSAGRVERAALPEVSPTLCVTSELENLLKKNTTRQGVKSSEKYEYSYFSHEFKRRLVLGFCPRYKLIQGGPDAPMA